MDGNQFQPDDIFNCDKTGCTTVQRPKCNSAKQVGSIMSWERGKLIRVVYTVSALGNVILPLFISLSQLQRPFCQRSTTGLNWLCNAIRLDKWRHLSGVFTTYHKEHQMLTWSQNSAYKGQSGVHISLKVIDAPKANGIILLTIPPYTSHHLQLLDRSVYGPFKAANNGRLLSNPGKVTQSVIKHS